MRTWVALLYSIILGGGRRVVMADLRDLAASLGYARPRTLVASGNLIFEADAADARAIEARLEPGFAAAFGKPVPIIVRDAADWPRLMRGNPFAEAAARDPARVAVRIMRAPLDAATVTPARALPRPGRGRWRWSAATSGCTCRKASRTRVSPARSPRPAPAAPAPSATGTPSAASAARWKADPASDFPAQAISRTRTRSSRNAAYAAACSAASGSRSR